MRKKDSTTYKLNKDQLKSITHTKGPLLIIAGAGTGKTTVITEKVKYLISKGLAKPEEILALTFTEKAALEMEERVDKIMPLSYGDIFITTFHSFCDQLLREEGLHMGLPTDFKVMTKEKTIDLIKKNLFDFKLDYFRPLGNPDKFIESILNHFSRLQDEVIRPDDYLLWVKKLKKAKTEEEKLENKKWKELALVYKEYDNLKLKDARLDFGDLIIKSIELFNKRPNILKKYREKFKYILVDEYQDTNYAQNELVKMMINKDKNITVVGDDNQSIYRFRGAAISNILDFKKTYQRAKTITLTKNYRSTQKILDSAYKLIKHNNPDTLEVRLKISKKLKSQNNKGINPKFDLYETGENEAEGVIEKIIKLNSKKKYNWRDFSILVRANNHADSFKRELERRGVPHQFLGPSKLFEKEEIIDLVSFLRSLYDPYDFENFYRFLSSDFFGIDNKDLIKTATQSKKQSISLYEEVVDKKEFEKPINIFNKLLKQINKITTGEILYQYLTDTGIYEKILQNEEDIKAKNIATFFQKIKTYENENPNAMLRQIVDYLNLLSEVGESPSVNEDNWQENNAVNILTVHSAKGLEFPVVFLVNLVKERFPSRNRSEQLPIPEAFIKEELPKGDFHIQEERRLAYVGMTRAKEKLFLTASRFYGDAKRQKKISPFVLEALGEDVGTQLFKDSNSLVLKNDETKIKRGKKKSNTLLVNFLSVSQIETFKTCPLHYKLKYIYNIPTPITPSISFGISIHETLKNFYSKDKKISMSVIKKDMLEIYKRNWIEEGYLNKKHKEEFFKKGKQYLLGYLKNEYDRKTKTLGLEEKFVIKIKDLKVGGTIDRLDKLPDGKLEIVDYKTGATIPTQKEVDKNLQLSVYALAVTRKYKIKPEDIKLSLYYLDNQEKISTIKTEKQLKQVKKEILETKKEIENSSFKCSNHYFCQKGCEFSMFCKVQK